MERYTDEAIERMEEAIIEAKEILRRARHHSATSQPGYAAEDWLADAEDAMDRAYDALRDALNDEE